jgi:hypothetical protein
VQLPWLEVKKEMTEEKGLSSDVADKIGEYVKHKGSQLRFYAELTISSLSSYRWPVAA